MKNVLFFILLVLFGMTETFAQYTTNENMAWVFGSGAGVNFLTGSPVPFTSSMAADEGCASVSDASGHLLFYTNGKTVWNRAHAIMPSGTSIVPFSTMSSTQGALILPVPAAPGKYYVFSLGDYSLSGPNDHLTYSVVDMSLDSGMGDVDATTYTEVMDSLREEMITIKKSDCNVWLIVRSWSGDKFYTFDIGPSGISAPVISACGFPLFPGYFSYVGGVLKSSSNSDLLVAQSQNFSLYGWTELFRFDQLTGVITNFGVLDSTGYNYGAEFSPDNTKLYTWRTSYAYPIPLPSLTETQICQYDVSLPTINAIRASRTSIVTIPAAAGQRRELKLAPDDKIYVTKYGSHYLDRISNPNIGGIGCGYTANAVDLGTGVCKCGLPNIVTVPVMDVSKQNYYITECSIEGIGYNLHIPPSDTGMHYTWFDGSILPFHNVTTSGTYWVYIYSGCDMIIDTFHVSLEMLPSVNLGNDTTINEGGTLILSAPHPPGTNCYWSTGSTTDTIHVSTTGTYWVVLSTELCRTSDTINIIVPNGITPLQQNITKSIFPNPANENIFIKVTGLSGNIATINCYNTIGAQVTTQKTTLQNETLNTSMYVGNLPSGIYEIRIEDEAGRKVTERITVNR